MSTSSPSAGPEASSLRAARAAIVAWFELSQRDLPWRRTRDPYAVWVSEIMLQQTRVETVAPRYARWMARFPSVTALAAAPLDDVLAEWAGLGYYARARNLHASARLCAAEHGGQLPRRLDEIGRLPGIGRYTAGAIASIAFEFPAPILDGNVERVLARLFAVGGDVRAQPARGRLWRLAERMVEPADDGALPSQVNQGMMELGALLCSPRRPRCPECPVAALCQARSRGAPEALPEKPRAQRVTELSQVALALWRGGKILLVRRPPEGLWGGLFELPSGEPTPGESLVGAARRIAAERVGLRVDAAAIAPLPAPAASFQHLLSHRRVTFHGYRAAAPSGRVRRTFYDAHRWVAPEAARTLGVSRATDRIIKTLAATAALEPPRRRKSIGQEGT
jgi:A/G-specific adenine glycosylase